MNWLIARFKNVLKYKAHLFVLFLFFISFVIYSVNFFRDTPEQLKSVDQKLPNSQHVLCVIVPYRDRFEHLLKFVPYMSEFLNRQSIRYHIVVINQLPDGYRFNRGSTLNAGFLIIREKFPECDYIAIHDIDTLPLTDEIPYTYPGNVAFHAIPLGYHPIYSYPAFISGIFLIPNELFFKVDGFGNNYWGWGIEDDNFHYRLIKNYIPLKRLRAEDLSTDETNSFRHSGGPEIKRDIPWCRLQLRTAQNGLIGVDETGLHDINYTVSSANILSIDGFPVRIFNINLKCIFELTPWCKPYCMENVTSPRGIRELSGSSSKSQQIKLTNLASIQNSPMWNRIMNEASRNY